MRNFELLKQEIDNGIAGKNAGVPMGFERLNKYISIRKRIYTLAFGPTGSGKTALVHDAWILNPFEYYMREKYKNPKLKLKIILFSMERSKIYTISKWLSRKIFLSQGILIPIGKLLGWWDTKLTPDEHDLVLMYEDYINELTEDFVDIIEGPQNPTGVYKYVKNYAEKHGKVEEVSEFKKVYIPDNENEIVIPIGDHFGLAKIEKGQSSKKEAIDKLSEYFQVFRDFYGYSPVAIFQINRDLSNPIYQKMTSFEPTLDSIKESGRGAEDCDVAISLFDPLRYGTEDKAYKANEFVDKNTGAKFFRTVKILKNSYGEDDIRAGMAFHGAIGAFKELPKPQNMEEFNYQSVLNGTYFLQDKNL